MTGTGSYAMYKAKQEAENAPTKPSISLETGSSDSMTKIVVTSEKETIDQVQYYWNDETPKTISGNSRKYIEQETPILSGTNILHVIATNSAGQISSYDEEMTRDSDISIQFEVSGSNIKIKLEGQSDIQYITYRWDDEAETKLDINQKTSEQEIETQKGLHTLTVTAVDVNNTQEVKEQEINGVMKPEVNITTDGSSNFVITASDENGLKKVEFIINETEKYMLNLDGRTTLNYSYPLHDGENKIEVTVYNENDVYTTFKAKLTK